jgi:GT2 family glycosyltransferase
VVTVSIVIVSYNTKDLTVGCIKSVIESVGKSEYEVVVVDNGSKDGSVAKFKQLEAEVLKKTGNKLKIIENKINLGFSKANNQGISASGGKYILLLNSDTTVEKTTIKKLLDFCESKPDAAAAVPRLLNLDGSIQPSVFKFPGFFKAVKQYWLKWGRDLDKYYPKTNRPIEVDISVMAAFLITPLGLAKVGNLSEKYFMYFEDFDYCRRIRKAGLKVYYVPYVKVYHFHGGSGKELDGAENQWRRLIPSSIIYHGKIKHYLLNFVIWSGQKLQKPGKTIEN